ncbi:MAG: methyltransferase [Treponema sp.]|nr:methyltransferase [Treponema sp.]
MEIANVKTEKTVFGGNTIAKIDSKTVFIPFTLPDEKLSINIVQHKNDYDNAEIVNILEESPNRVKPACKYYGLCGGCNMMHIAPDFQRELRKNMLKDAFTNNKIEIPFEIESIYGPDFNYRARFQLTDGGLSQRNSKKIVKIEECLCAEEAINTFLNKNSKENQNTKGRVHIFGSKFINEAEKIKISSPDEKENVDKNIQFKKKYKQKENKYFAGTIISPENTVTVSLNGKDISFDVRGFFQSNLFVFEKVLSLIQSLLPGGKSILDMYSGCGSISCFLAEKYENVTLVEHNRDALVFAEKNMAGKSHISYGLSGAKWVETCAQYAGNFDACMIDPPRSGMEIEVCNYLCKSKIPVILSMSCDPATHARDISKLIKNGYKLERLFLLDFYPNTSHIESLALLRLGF